MKVWIIVSVMFLMENSQVKIAETVNDSSRFFNTEKQCLNSLKNKMIMPEAQSRKARTLIEKKLVEIYGTYQKALRDNDALDFDDLLLYPLKIFEDYPKILAKYQNLWKSKFKTKW